MSVANGSADAPTCVLCNSQLRDAGIVALQDGGGYTLTAEGRALGTLLLPLHRWAKGWARRAHAHRAGRGVDPRPAPQ